VTTRPVHAAPRPAAVALLVLAAALGGCRREAPAPTPGTEQVASSLAAIVATCAVAVGDVEVRRAGKEGWSPVTTGAVLRDGDAIRTGPGAFARVAFVSGNGIELEEESSALVDVARAAGLAAGGGGTEIAVTGGEARVEAGAGRVSLGAGRAVDVGAAGVGAPVELIDFPPSLRPGVDARFPLSPDLRVALAWQPLAAASGYRVQIARDLSFREVVLARNVSEQGLAFAPTGPGMYAWRVAARDAGGRQGEYGFARRVYVDQAPPRDLLLAPAPDAVVRGGASAAVRFAWSGERRARAYRLVIASAPELTERAVRAEATSAASLAVRGLAPGEYWWGVYEDDERRDPLFVAPRRLVVLRAKPAEVKVPRAVNEWGR
jgi:hypothetical protein